MMTHLELDFKYFSIDFLYVAVKPLTKQQRKAKRKAAEMKKNVDDVVPPSHEEKKNEFEDSPQIRKQTRRSVYF